MRKSTPHVSAVARDFIAQRHARSGSDQQRYSQRSLLARFAASVNDCQVGSLTPAHVEDFFYGREGLHNTCQPSTLAMYRIQLKSFFAFCYRRGYTTAHPELMIDGLTDKTTRSGRERTRLTADELLRLLDGATDPRDRALAAFVMNTAVRISEALYMRVSDVRLDRSEASVYIVKTKKYDVMPVTTDLEVELRSWLTQYANSLAPRALKGTDFLFPSRQVGGDLKRKKAAHPGYRPALRIGTPQHIFKKMATGAGITVESGDGWHTIRRSVARIYFDNASAKGHDAALRETSALLHHTNTKTTEDYLGLSLERKNRDAVLKGQPFLSNLVSDANVVPITRREATNG